jgi:hypothetical protein
MVVILFNAYLLFMHSTGLDHTMFTDAAKNTLTSFGVNMLFLGSVFFIVIACNKTNKL